MPDPQPCTYCNGSGRIQEVEMVGEEMQIVDKPCPACGGTGRA
jgi:DnaJ-class molecular chaperone